MNIEAWTLGSIVVMTSAIILLIGNIKKLRDEYKSSVRSVVKEEIAPIDSKIDELATQIKEVDMNSTKDFLVARFGEVERSGECDEITRQRIYEEMSHYEELGGNNYIHARFEELKKSGKI